MEAQNKKSVITWGSYVAVLGTFISVWISGALDFIDDMGTLWDLTPLQVILVPVVGIGIGLAFGEGISRVKPGASISEYVKAGTEEAEKFLQAGLGTTEGQAKRITGQWGKKVGDALGKFKASFTNLVRRGDKAVLQARASDALALETSIYPAPAALLAEVWQAVNQAFSTAKAKVRAVTTSRGRAAEVTVFPVQEYDPSGVQSRQAYLSRRTKVLVAFAIIIASAFLIMTIIKVITG